MTYQFATLAVHAGAAPDAKTGAVIPPISLLTTFAQTTPGNPIGEYEYLRLANPNRDALETSVAALEQGKHAIAVSSGSAATAIVVNSLRPGDHIVLVADVYGGTHRYFTKVAVHQQIEVLFAGEDIVSELALLVKPSTKLVWVETPSNPTLGLTDIAAVAAQVAALRAKGHDLHLVVDNTFLLPYIQNPLVHGADVVVHLATKYINGHLDVVLGLIVTSNEALATQYRFLQNAIGAVPLPFDLWLAHRGIKTLHLRLERALANALKVAQFLAASDRVQLVHYPGLPLHKNHALVARQHRNGLGGGMVLFRIKGGRAAVDAFVQRLKVFTLAESLGGFELLVNHPAAMTHSGIPVEHREKVGVFDDLVRVSVGVEDAEDLVEDLRQALN